jgi:hypothetical protein
MLAAKASNRGQMPMAQLGASRILIKSKDATIATINKGLLP